MMQYEAQRESSSLDCSLEMPAAAECSGRRRRFAVACGVLSRCVRADAAAAAGKVLAVATPRPHQHPAAEQRQAASASSTMLLMPGADVGELEEADATPAPAQLTIMYGGRVLVFDGVRADTAAALVRAAAAARRDVTGGMMTDDVPVARKASLRRFMEKRRDRRSDAGAPYGGVARPSAAASKKGQEQGDAGCWLGLGITGGRCAR